MKTIFSFFVVILFTTISQGQSIKNELIAGINASQIDGDAMAGFNKPGLLLGGSTGFDIRKNFGLRFRILYSQKGSRNGENDPIFLVNRLNYLDFPLLFVFEPKENILLEGGLQVSFLTSAKIDDGFGFSQQRDQFETLPYSFILGIGYELDPFVLRLNYQRSLSYLTKIPGFLDRTLSFSVAYKLD
jgi:hypothetical protein